MTNIAVLANVGHHIDSFHLGLIDRWRQTGNQVVSAASTESMAVGHTILTSISRRPKLGNLRAANEIDRWMSKTSSDILLTNTAVASFLARTRKHVYPVVYFCHGLHWNTGRKPAERIWQALERSALRSTSGVITINEDDDKWFARHAPQIQRIRLPYGVGLDLAQYPARPMPDLDSGMRLIWAGEFYERKRPFLALDILSSLRGLGVDASLQMCGRGSLLEATRSRAALLGLGQHVRFPGQVSNIADRIADSHLLLMTSQWEGLPRIGLESLAVGRPVFAFDVKGTRSLPGVVVSPDGDVAAMASLISQGPTRFLPLDSDVDGMDVMRVADRVEMFIEHILRGPGLWNAQQGVAVS